MEAADHEKQLMKLVHEEMSAFFDVVDEKEFKEVVAKYPNSRSYQLCLVNFAI